MVNFTPVPRDGYRIGVPEAGRYAELVNSDAGIYGGGNVGNGGAIATEPMRRTASTTRSTCGCRRSGSSCSSLNSNAARTACFHDRSDQHALRRKGAAQLARSAA